MAKGLESRDDAAIRKLTDGDYAMQIAFRLLRDVARVARKAVE
jgi:hypothetical protein